MKFKVESNLKSDKPRIIEAIDDMDAAEKFAIKFFSKSRRSSVVEVCVTEVESDAKDILSKKTWHYLNVINVEQPPTCLEDEHDWKQDGLTHSYANGAYVSKFRCKHCAFIRVKTHYVLAVRSDQNLKDKIEYRHSSDC